MCYEFAMAQTREQNTKWKAQWRETHRAEARALSNKHGPLWRKRHPEQARALNRNQRAAWRKRNPGKQVKLNAAWQDAHPLEHLVRLAKQRAKKKGLEFNISVADLSPAPKFCPILGCELRYGSNFGTKGRCHEAATIDRKDSDLGYIRGNVWVISRSANRLKGRQKLDVFLASRP